MRNLMGAGARVTAMDKANVDIHVGSGVMYEMERWRAVEGDPASEFQKNIPKASSYVGLEFGLSHNSHLTFWGLHQVGFDKDDNLVRTRYTGEATLNFHISKRVTWTNRFSYFYDAQPVIPINNAYFQLTNGLQIRF